VLLLENDWYFGVRSNDNPVGATGHVHFMRKTELSVPLTVASVLTL